MSKESIKNDCSISRYTNFFLKDDILPVARKKWYDYIVRAYKYFWDVYLHKINYDILTDLESDPQAVILSRWVPRAVLYKEDIGYDHYIIMEQNETKDNSTKDLIPSYISSYKEKLIMMPRSHYEERITYSDSI